MVPVNTLCDKARSINNGLIRTSGKLPVRPFPDRCKVVSRGMESKQAGTVELIELVTTYDVLRPGNRVWRQFDAELNPSNASEFKVVALHMLAGK